jgi:hypothetical protein
MDSSPKSPSYMHKLGCNSCIRQILNIWIGGLIWALCLNGGSPSLFAEVVINEIMYHPSSENGGGEYVELFNNGPKSVDLSGWQLKDGIEYQFPQGTVLTAHDFLAVAKDANAAIQYYQATNIIGNFSGKLDNAGETITLWDSSNPRLLIDTVTYGNATPWPEAAAGGGSSLELLDPEQDNNNPLHWGAGQLYSPGKANNPATAGSGPIVITEIMYRPLREEWRQKFDGVNQVEYFEQGNDEYGEYIELFNRTTNSINLAGWKLTGGVDFNFPESITMAGRSYWVVAANPEAIRLRFGLENLTGPFTGKLSAEGERLTLRDAQDRVANTVKYGVSHPWPEAPAELGCSLECLNPDWDNSSPANWQASQASPAAFHQQWLDICVTNFADTAGLDLHLTGAGEWLVEDVRVQRLAGGPNLLPNGSFEPDLSGWTPRGNHQASQRTNGIAFTGTGCLWLRATGEGDNSENHVACSPVPGVEPGQYYRVSYRATWLRGTGQLALGWLGSGTNTTTTSWAVSSLAEEWSDTNNPSQAWSYHNRNGDLIADHLASWAAPDLGNTQPAWTDAGHLGIPGWAKSTGSSQAAGAPHPEYDFPAGKVMAHGPAEVWWTAPTNAHVYIQGGVWLLRHIGRSQRWYIKLNNTNLRSGDLPAADYTITSQSPMSFSSGTNSSILSLDLAAGDILKFSALPTAGVEDFVGFDITLLLGASSEKTNQSPSITAYIGWGTPGRANSAAADSLPPLVAELNHYPLQPRSTDSVTITARIESPTPLSQVQLATSLNWETNITICEMYDDGQHGDQAANDGIYGVILPPHPSQTLVHYSLKITDSHGSSSVFPYANDPSPTQAFYHYDDEIKSQLTQFHLFLPAASRAQLEANPADSHYVDCSLVINHVAYPHMGARYRGRRSRYNPEHPWKFRFNKAQLYAGNRTYDTMYSLPLEQEICFAAFDQVGIASLAHQLLRLHINGSFEGVYVGFESPGGAWLKKNGYNEQGEVYKARSGETPNQSKDSDLFNNQLITDLDFWGAYHKKVRPLEPPASARNLVTAVNDLSDAELLPWMDAHVDLDQWFKRWAMMICLNIDDFPVHNHYHFLPGDSGAKWRWLGYDFDSGLSFVRVGALRALYGDGQEGNYPKWQRNKLCARVSNNPTLRRIYLLTMRQMLTKLFNPDALIARYEELFALTLPDRQADAQRWGAMRTSTAEGKNTLITQRQNLLSYLAAANLPASDKIPIITPKGGRAALGSPIQMAAATNWTVYYTTDGSDPRLSVSRLIYDSTLRLTNTTSFKAAAIPNNESLEGGNWTDLVVADLEAVPAPEIAISQKAGQVYLNWPSTFSNQVVETTSQLDSGWETLSNAKPVLKTDCWELANPPTESASYYRLRTP